MYQKIIKNSAANDYMETRLTLGFRAELSPYELLNECRDQLMKEVVRRIDTVKNRRTVLITGENGTGKELVARAIVERGDRSKEPLVVLDCTNLDREVLRSELFGHRRGSFTGAHEEKIGLFEMAHGGTAFLDEIGEISLELQPRFLRVLQDGTFRRYGGTDEIRSDFRLITATNRDLADMVRRGQFREDLYYRLEVFSVSVPPLRRRTGDVVRLANHFLDEFSGRQKMLDPGAEEAIRRHPWPGNVRELRNAIERAVLFAVADGKPFITEENLELDRLSLVTGGGGFPVRDLGQPDLVRLVGILIDRIREAPEEEFIKAGGLIRLLEKLAIQHLLDESNGRMAHKVRVAKILGIGRQTLYNKIYKYGLRPGPDEESTPATATTARVQSTSTQSAL